MPNLNSINKLVFNKTIINIADAKNSREKHLEKIMKDFIQVPKHIKTIKEIEEIPFKNFIEDIKKEKSGINLPEYTEKDFIERKEYCDELYQEISNEINNSKKNTYEKNVNYIKQITGFFEKNEDIVDKNGKKTLVDLENLGIIKLRKYKAAEKMMQFIGDYITKISLNIENN